MTKQLTFNIGDLMLLPGTIEGRFGQAKVCIPIRSIKLFMEGRNPKTNEPVTAIILDNGAEIAFLEPIKDVIDEYNTRLNAIMQDV